MGDIDTGKNLLLSIAPKLKNFKERFLQLLILNVIDSFKKVTQSTFEGIKEGLTHRFKISLDRIFLKSYIDELRKRGEINVEIGEDSKVYHKVEKKGREIIKRLERHRGEVVNEFFDRIVALLPENDKQEASEFKKEIVADFIIAFSKAIDRNYYDAILQREPLPIYKHVELRCEIKSSCSDLRNKLSEVYTKIANDRKSPLFSELLSLSLFWNSFTRISSMKKEAREMLVQEIEKTQIFADTNTIIAYCCHIDPVHDKTREYYDFLKNQLQVELYYTEETEGELQRYLNVIRKAVKYLQYYPGRARLIAKELNDDVLQAFFYENYISWEEYYQDFMDVVKENFKLYRKGDLTELGIEEEEVRKGMEEIMPDVAKYMNKGKKVAEHDSYLISLVRILREKRSNSWFNYVDWVSTLDLRFRTFDRYVGENTDPVSFLVKLIPFYFHPYHIAKAINDESENDLQVSYDILYYATFKLNEEYETLRSTVQEIGAIEKIDQLKEKLLNFTKNVLFEEV